MVAEEVLVNNGVFQQIGTNINFNLDLTRDCYIGTQKAIKKSMLEFAKIKVEEALEIAAEKAKIKTETKYKGRETPKVLGSYTIKHATIVDKDSILNAINLDEFIK